MMSQTTDPVDKTTMRGVAMSGEGCICVVFSKSIFDFFRHFRHSATS
jgi:hypothetical protein